LHDSGESDGCKRSCVKIKIGGIPIVEDHNVLVGIIPIETKNLKKIQSKSGDIMTT